MESIFFNTPKQCYKITKQYEQNGDYIEQVDISNGILFFDIKLMQKRRLNFGYIDNMLFVVLVSKGGVVISSDSKRVHLKDNTIATFINSNNPFEIEFRKNSSVFMLFVADFFLKRHLSFRVNEPIDFVYNKMHQKEGLIKIIEVPLDAFSQYLTNKIKETKNSNIMQSIKCMYRSLEFIVHNLSMLDIIDETLSKEAKEIAKRAKNILLTNYVEPPTIKMLSKMCATNEFTLKQAFKAAYNTTIYKFIQKQRLERANLLLKEGNLSIKEVANCVGYSHSGYFAKLFFKNYGVYPKEVG
jgi:AraC-like DNA-binding protein